MRRRPQAWLRAARPAAPPAAPVWEEWEDVAKHNGRVKRKRSRGTRSVVQVQTGYLPETLDEMWAGAAPYFMHVHNGGGKLRGLRLVAPPVGAGNTYRQDTFRKILSVRY